MRTRLAALSPIALGVLLLAGCAAQLEHGKGMDLLAQGKPAEAVESLRRANTLEPDNVRYRIDYLNQRSTVVQNLVTAADEERSDGKLDAAIQRYREAARVDPANPRVKSGLQAVEAERRSGTQLQAVDRLVQANQTEPALEQVRRVLKENPQHPRALALQRSLEERADAERQAREEQLAARAAFKRPVTLNFRDTPLKVVFEAIGRIGNVNVIVDRDVKSDLRTTIFVKDAAIEDTLDVILLQNQLEKRVLNSNTLLIYPATAAKQKELAELKVRSFQLSNIDVAFMANIVKTMLKTKDIVTDVKTNTLVIRDTPEAVALAERLIAANDVPDAEVMLEVEVLEISASRASDIGLILPSSFTVSTPSLASTIGGLRALTRNDLQASGLSATLNLMLQDSDTKILASPRIRTRNKEKAKILVGDKLPVITNLISQGSASGSSNNVVTGSIQYVEVGIKLEVEPHVYADGDVGIKLNLEVSNVTDTIKTDSGRAYQIGTRSAQTSLRLHDGETQVMAGLINDIDRNLASKVPGVGQFPLLGRLFSNNAGNANKTEIVLSITPRIIRPQAQPDPRFADAWSGSESSLRDRQLRLEPLAVVKATTPKAGGAAPAPAVAPLRAPARGVAPVAPVVPVPAAPAASGAAGAAGAAPTPAAEAPATGAAAAPGVATAPTGMPGLPLLRPRPLPGRVAVAPAAAASAPDSAADEPAEPVKP